MTQSSPEQLAAVDGVVLEVAGLVKEYPVRHSREVVHAVRGVSFRIRSGETVALVGETGCGKTTVARSVAGLVSRTSGTIHFQGTLVAERERVNRSTGLVQMVFQSPGESLNPTMTVREILEEALRLKGTHERAALEQRLQQLVALAGLEERVLVAEPGTLTAGEQQKVSIARAIATDPLLIILDEPTSQLDAGARRQVLDLLAGLQQRLGTAYLCITHDMRVVARLSHRIAVMYLGLIVEEGPTAEILHRPRHPYTIALMASILRAHPGARAHAVVLEGEVPSAIQPPEGCPLHPRCPFAETACSEPQEWRAVPGSPGHFVACRRSEELAGLIATTREGH